jgi:hypothetical protein
MCDIETIDAELRLLVAIRQMVREEEGRTPNTRRIDQLLDDRAAAERQGQGGEPALCSEMSLTELTAIR